MAIELTDSSIEKLCHGTFVRQPIVQLLGYEAVKEKNNDINYRLVLSDGIHMNSYFYLDTELNNLITQKQVKYGTVLRIDKFRFMNGENCTDQSPRWIIFIQEVTVLIHRNVYGNPLPLINIEKKEKPLTNLNLNEHPSRVFNNFEELENNLISVKDLKKQASGKCTCVLKLNVIRKFPISTYSSCRVLNINMEDSSGVVRVSAFNSLSDRMNNIFEENKTYYITDTSLKHNGFSNEIKLQSYSVVIECNEIEQITQSVESTKSLNFRALLDNNPNTFCDLIGVCIEVGNIEVCGNSITQTEIAKRDITLIDMSSATVKLKVWGKHVNIFDEKFDDPPIVMVKQAVLKQFNGIKHFSMIKNSVLSVNPNMDETQKLKEWYEQFVEEQFEDF